MLRLASILRDVTKKSHDILVLEEKKELIIVSDEAGLSAIAKDRIKKEGLGYKVNRISPKQLLDAEILPKVINAFSLKNEKTILELSGMKEKCIVSYSLENLSQSKKTIFGYALRGRKKGTGILRELGGETLGRNCVVLPNKNFPQLTELLDFWKISYETRIVAEKYDFSAEKEKIRQIIKQVKK